MAVSADGDNAAPSPATRRQLTVISAGASEPSSTRMLADRIAQRSLDLLRETGDPATVRIIELAPLAVDVARAAINAPLSDELQGAIESVAAADAIIASTPVYKAGVSGLFKSFMDILDDDLLIAKPVLLAASAGSSRHALVVDEQMRPLFAYMRALTLPTSVFAAPEDWAAPELSERIRRAATELAVILQSPIEQRVADRAWSGYEHHFAGNASRAERTAADIDFDSPLMRLAAGGRAPERPASEGEAGVADEAAPGARSATD
jgi:FMN reductase